MNTRHHKHEDKEVADWDKLPATPLVSVCFLTYNHREYIRQALDGILSQNVSFPYEICIGEDGSTDGTREICMEYAEKYPGYIRLFLRDRLNEKRKKYKIPYIHNAFEIFKACRGKYLAFCEGDDYWSDENKLAEQVECLEQNPDCNICFHDVLIVDEIGRHPKDLQRFSQKKEWRDLINKGVEFGLKDVAKGGLIHTTAGLARNKDINDYPAFALQSSTMDWEMRLFLCGGGKIKYINKVMSAYRIHEKGASNKLLICRDGLYSCRISILAQFDHYYGYKYHAELCSALLLWWNRIDLNKWRWITFFRLLYLSPRNAWFYGKHAVIGCVKRFGIRIQKRMNDIYLSCLRVWRTAKYERKETKNIKKAMCPVVRDLIPGKMPVVLYGAGKHTERLVRIYRSKLNIKAIFDDNPGHRMICNIPVTQPVFETLGKEVLLISSNYHEDALFQKAKSMVGKNTRVVRLYGQ